MAIVSDWQNPLDESLAKVLSLRDLSPGDLEEIRRSLSMLDSGSKEASRLVSMLDRRVQDIDQQYRKAVQDVEESPYPQMVEMAVNRLKALGNYKDSLEKIRLGNERSQKLRSEAEEREKRQAEKKKRRRRITVAAVIVAVVAIVTGITVTAIRSHQQKAEAENRRREQIETLTARVKALTDEGSENEIISPLEELAGLEVPASDLKALSEPALQQLARRDGFAAAFALRDQMVSENPGIIDDRSFNSWADKLIGSGDIPPEESWVIVRDALQSERMRETDDRVTGAYVAYFSLVTENAAADADWDAAAWVSDMSPWLTSVPVSTDSVLSLCSSLNRSGHDPAALFPDGIAVDIPFGASVAALNDFLFSGSEASDIPEMTKILPLKVIEKPERDLYASGQSSKEKLDQHISELQASDAHYTVLLFPADLIRLPDTLRPETFEEATCAVVMQQTYLPAGYIKRSFTTVVNGVKLPGTTVHEYYTAMDALVLYDLHAKAPPLPLLARTNDPVVADDDWFERNKNGKTTITDSADYMLGHHDPEEIQKQYSDFLDLVNSQSP